MYVTAVGERNIDARQRRGDGCFGKGALQRGAKPAELIGGEVGSVCRNSPEALVEDARGPDGHEQSCGPEPEE